MVNSEEYSSEEDDCDSSTKDTQPLVDPKTLTWIPYIGYMFWWVGSQTLAVCDYLGENLAWFLGITSPKFQYEIDQIEKIMKKRKKNYKNISNLKMLDGVFPRIMIIALMQYHCNHSLIHLQTKRPFS
ncbi:protein FAM177A1 [Caerostris extrusa]|uniref:Protein FAM177A1 n=1 Tax=Caerostris extrusa TaxID=172846 RepID=A0AAV4NK29_CAEEX|nr:protein FAM177A1 [Caerostris extrusa]